MRDRKRFGSRQRSLSFLSFLPRRERPLLAGKGPTKMPFIAGMEEKAVWFESCWGPVFGEGFDLAISNDANRNTESHSYLGRTYQCPRGQPRTFFTGSTNFVVTDYEVFGFYPEQQTGERGSCMKNRYRNRRHCSN